MKQSSFYSSHQCHSTQPYKNKKFKCTPTAHIPQPIIRCDGYCFQRNFYQRSPHYLFRESSCSKGIYTKQKYFDPSSYRVTVRRIISSTAVESCSAHRNVNVGQIYLEPFNHIVTSNDRQFSTPQNPNIYNKNDLNFDNSNIPSVPSKKIVPTNKGIQASSTSFIITTDDQKSFISDIISETNSEDTVVHTQSFNASILPMRKVETSNNDSLSLSKLKSTLLNNNVLENIQTKRNSINKEQLFIQPESIIDEAKKLERYSPKEKFSSSQISSDHTSYESNTSQESILPNIEDVKSNAMLVHPSQSLKSVTSLNNEKQKSSTDIKKSNLTLRNVRSALNVGLLFDETMI
ncbi:unnamed protein product [Adineta steineri]|uniref:Uncharacterized protein n=1 Tax=Adineta steineri TaxID=433720 RepID=A0A818IZW0_9BILA|nr:unnamed protein product [Adineta steineri]CAF1305019.1 unnamed protein product [Adineta steineri]CAF1344648.1 unnamed protein product [Adineta steineri]CAF3532410.1 unnamed protein product [Adineta steineri]CAF3583982.1 unnamed protein product [Adineta steineri]